MRQSSFLLSVSVFVALGAAPLMAQCNPQEEAEVGPAIGFSGDRFGKVLARSGNTLVVAAPEAQRAYVFERNFGPGAPWVETATLLGNAGYFAISAAIDGDTIVIGAPKDFGSGNIRIFGRDQGGAGNWGLVKKVLANVPVSGDFFGGQVAISGDTILVAATEAYKEQYNEGSVYVFERDKGGPDQWGQAQRLWSTNPLSSGQFGSGLALEGNRAYIGEPGHPNASYSGFVRIYEHNGQKWELVKTLSGSNPDAGDTFGASVAAQGDELVVGAPYKGGGRVYVFERDNGGAGQWGEVIRLGVPALGDAVGTSVSIDGDLIAAGAPTKGITFSSGRTLLFGRGYDGLSWGLMSKIKGSNLGVRDHFGSAIALAGGELVAGTDEDNAPGTIYHFEGLVEYPYAYCTSGLSASTCLSVICGDGTPSATAASGFVVSAGSMEGNKTGLFYFGSNGQQALSWGNGKSFQCVVGPVQRGALLSGGGTNGACDGSYSQDFNSVWNQHPSQNPGAGSVVQVQLWTRDPLNTSSRKTILSNGLQFTVLP